MDAGSGYRWGMGGRPRFRLSEAQRAWLRAAGVHAPETWAAFRLGLVPAEILRRHNLIGRSALRPDAGVSLPTWDLRDPSCIQGIIRVVRVQHRHRFATAPPAGIAGPVSLAAGDRIVLCDAPLVAMRLHQEGCAEVAVVGDVAVLRHCADALRARTVLVASVRRAGVERMTTMLRALRVPVDAAFTVQSDITRCGPAVLIGRQSPPTDMAELLRWLVPVAQRHGAFFAGYRGGRHDRHGLVILIDQPMARAYGMGVIPRLWRLREAGIPIQIRHAVRHLGWEVATVWPSIDESGAVVDMMLVPWMGSPILSCWPSPRGIIMPEGAVDGDEVVACSAADWPLVVSFMRRNGDRPMWLIRGPEDASQHVRRLHQRGVRRCRLWGADALAIAQRLRRGGLAVQVMVGSP